MAGLQTPKTSAATDFKLFLLLCFLVFFPVTFAITLAWLFTKFSRAAYAAIASTIKPQSLSKFKHWFLCIMLLFQSALLALVIWWFESNSIQFLSDLWKPHSWWVENNLDQGFEIFEWIAILMSIIFLLTTIFNDLLILIFDKIIAKTYRNDLRRQEDAYASGETLYIRHPLLKFVSFCTSYKYSQKVGILIEKNLIASKIKANIDNGMIVNKELDIMFLKKFWPKHVLFAGTSNTGKTNDISNWLLSAAYLNCPIIYIYSDDSDDNIQSDLSKISTVLNKTHTQLSFSNPNLKYNPFFHKNSEEIISLLTAATVDPLNPKSAAKVTSIITSIIAFMQQNNVPLTIENIFIHLDQDFLKRQYLFSSVINKYTNTSLIELVATDKDTEALLFFQLIKDIYKAFPSNFSSSPDAINFRDILASKASNSILSISIPTTLPAKTAKLLDRLFMQDIKVNAPYSESQRAADKTKTIVCFSGLSDLFNTPHEVTHYLNLFSSKQICFGYGIKTYSDRTAEDSSVFKQIFNTCGTYFIHKNADVRIKENLLAEISDDRLVSPGFMVEDVMRKYKNQRSDLGKDSKQSTPNIMNIKETLVENSSYLQNGQVIFKSTVSETTETAMGYKLEKDIVFNMPIQCMHFSKYLEYVKDKISGKEQE